MKLIVGLGNPGSQYERTRHNVGFMAVDMLARKRGSGGGGGNFRIAHESFVSDVMLEGTGGAGGARGQEKIVLLKPQTYMNLSGRAVASAVQFYKLNLEDLLVVVDDVALPVGTIRLRASGSAGGHNGLKDIERAVASLAISAGKTAQDYSRLRIGVDPPGILPQREYVLTPFTSEQRPKLESALKAAVDAMEVWATEGIVAAMNRFNAGDKG
jgi:PTH1 family peptidyl-tRNA hydrolase